jgi:hypothetical protein
MRARGYPAMNNNKVTMPNTVWVAIVAAFLLIFGSVWFASSVGTGVRGEASVSKPDVPPIVRPGGIERTDLAGPPVAAPEVSVPVVQVTSGKPGLGVVEQKPKQPVRKITPRDMFPVGDITRDLPAVNHPYRQIAELFPSFEYEGKVWSTTGRYVRGWEADLTPTGYSLGTGQKLYALANTSAPDAVLFVRSDIDPDKFAVYRAT